MSLGQERLLQGPVSPAPSSSCCFSLFSFALFCGMALCSAGWASQREAKTPVWVDFGHQFALD